MVVAVRVLVCSALLAPVPALADCAERVALLESKVGEQNPDGTEKPGEEAAASASSGQADSRSPTEVVKEDVIGAGKVVSENGGETVYRESGPALPRENWFGSPPDKSAAVAHLAAAQKALDAGDEQACLTAVDKGEQVLAAD